MDLLAEMLLRACLDCRNSKEIPKECSSSISLTSYTVWNKEKTTLPFLWKEMHPFRERRKEKIHSDPKFSRMRETERA